MAALLLHALSAAVLTAAGLAIGTRLVRANLGGGDRRAAARAARRLDLLLATPAAVLLALSAAWLVRRADAPDGWLKLSLALSVATTLFWLAASAMQRRAAAALEQDAELHRGLFGLAFLFGWPALPVAALLFLLALQRLV